jgi:tetratricopeptide (TPR) repeat protein
MIAILVAACVVGLAAPVAAQSVSDVERDDAVDEETRRGASERIEQQSSNLDEKKGNQEGPSGPNITQEQATGENLSPQEVERLKQRLEAKNREMIKKLDRLIENNPYADAKPEWMFQKAELMWDLRNMEYMRKRAEYNQCLMAADKGTVDKSTCNEPEADYSDAQAIYKRILTEYPEYDRLDEVIFRLGKGLLDADKGPQAISYLQRLVKNYPNSKYIPEANLALAEYFFKKELLGAARDKYKRVLDYENNPNYDYALYKLGWVYYNRSQFQQSVDTFKQVIERTNEKLGFQNQALNDLVSAYAEVPDGWKKLRSYLLEDRERDEEYVYGKLARMAGLYEGQGKDRQAIEVYTYFIDERPNHEKIPSWMESIIAAKKNINDFQDLEKTINRYVAYLSDDGTWWKTNEGNENWRNEARNLKMSTLAFLANRYHKRAQENDKYDDLERQTEETTSMYRSAAKYYQEYIKRFTDHPSSFDMNFFVAEIHLLDLGNFEQAAERYQNVVDMYEADNYPKEIKEKELMAIVQDAAYGRVKAYDELVKKNHPDSILVKMAEYQEQQGDTYAEKTQEEGPPSEKDPNEKVELLKFEKGFVKASDQYAEMFPKTEITPTVDFVAAEVYKARGHYAECIDRYESIIENAPEHRYASFAGNSLLEANYVLDRWDEVEKWARYLLQNKIFDVSPKPALKSAIAYAINERAKDLDESGKTVKAANELLRLYNEFPDSELAPGALFNAAAFFERADDVKKAVKYYEQVVAKYPETDKAPEALFVLGAISESRANFGKAADYFVRLAEEEYRDAPQAADAVYNAASLREAMEDWDKAIATYKKYIDLFEGERDDIREVKLKMGFLEQERNNPKKAMDEFMDFLDREDVKPEEEVELHTQVGLIMEDTKPDEWKEKSDEHFTEAVKTWQNMEDEAKKTGMRHSASHARFRQAERMFQDFQKVELTFPMNKLQDRLEEKAEKQQKAEKVYTEIIEMRSPRWASAAAYRIGESYNTFYKALYNLPLPEGLNEQQKMEYRFTLDERAAPLQEKAVQAYTSALNVALRLQAYNEWSRKSAAKITDLRSAEYPITGQKGVDPEHGRIKFYAPKALTDFDTAIQRAKARYARRPPEPEPGEGAEEGETEAGGAEQSGEPAEDGDAEETDEANTDGES